METRSQKAMRVNKSAIGYADPIVGKTKEERKRIRERILQERRPAFNALAAY